VDEGVPADPLEQRMLRIGALLEEAEERLAGPSGARVAFVGALAILLREGLEGALLVLLLLGWARRAGAETGAARGDARAVHGGWLAAVAAGALTWIAAGAVLTAVGGARRELIEGVVALVAVVVLLAASHFVLARLDAARRVAALKRRLAAVSSTPRRRLVLASLAFVAVYREAFEVVLFLRALMLDSAGGSLAVVAGAIAGGGACVIVVLAMSRLGQKLRPGPLLTAAGTLLCSLAVVLAGKGVRSLQEAGFVAIDPLTMPRLDWLGVYPTMQTTMAQLGVLAAFAAILVWAVLPSPASSAPTGSPRAQDEPGEAA
jgi:high-affinity iron transporter